MKLDEKIEEMLPKNELKNYGFDPSKVVISPEDFVLGGVGALPRNKILTNGRTWDDYKPLYEPQFFKTGGDTKGCVLWGMENAQYTTFRITTCFEKLGFI